MYWLKPFDAINDTANAIALLQFDWEKKPILEIGGGDGVFAFIMHGGEFKFLDDRYSQTDLSLSPDIYDVYKKGESLAIKRHTSFQFDVGVDLKLSHLLKGKETKLYRHNNLISSKPEALPFKNNIFSAVFLYTFHGLSDYRKTLREIRRVMKKSGSLLMIVANEAVKGHFVYYRMHKYCKNKKWNGLSKYFLKLDGGRCKEIGELFAKRLHDWKILCKETGFDIEEIYNQVSPIVWRIYETQTRPFLKPFIRFSSLLKRIYVKPIAKFLWIYLWLPTLIVFYYAMARPVKINIDDESRGVFFAIKTSLI